MDDYGESTARRVLVLSYPAWYAFRVCEREPPETSQQMYRRLSHPEMNRFTDYVEWMQSLQAITTLFVTRLSTETNPLSKGLLLLLFLDDRRRRLLQRKMTQRLHDDGCVVNRYSWRTIKTLSTPTRQFEERSLANVSWTECCWSQSWTFIRPL